MSALVMVFRDEDRVFPLVPRFWIPGDNAKKGEDRDRVRYATTARQSLIEMTPGSVVN